MALPTREEAQKQLGKYVADEYQRHHALMVATAMEGYADMFNEDPDLWYITGLLHDIDFEQHPNVHPAESLKWFKEWDYPEELIHAVEAHAYEYNGFTTLPQTKLAAALMACDEISGIFYEQKDQPHTVRADESELDPKAPARTELCGEDKTRGYKPRMRASRRTARRTYCEPYKILCKIGRLGTIHSTLRGTLGRPYNYEVGD